LEVLLLPVDEELYSLPMEFLREVIARPRITRVPTAPATILGLVNVRGEIVPLFDVAALLGTGHISTAAFAVVIEIEGGRAALATSAVPESGVVDERAGEAPQSEARGVYSYGERLTTLLDPEATLAGVYR
jgi:purine-binding chemotaxis protein CheW